eukprot:4783881-Pyramimonas_sp.AAC.1
MSGCTLPAWSRSDTVTRGCTYRALSGLVPIDSMVVSSAAVVIAAPGDPTTSCSHQSRTGSVLAVGESV